jgi:glycosyltransferase involved in cell wall biosynthesis
MRVLFLQQQPCIRTLKLAAGLRGAPSGVRIGFACRGRTLTGFYGTGDELFDRWWRLDERADPRRALQDVLDEFRPDLVHSHNLPDELTVLALEVTGGAIPVVHDVHDFQSLRSTPYEDMFAGEGWGRGLDPLTLEKLAVEGSSALLTVSDELLAEIAARYTLPDPAVVFGNYVLGDRLPAELPPAERPRGRPWRVVYQGTLSSGGGHYDLKDLFRGLAAAGIDLHVYPSRPVPEYRSLPAVTCHDTLDPDALLRVLPHFDAGWAGFNDRLNGAHLATVLPNKVFEYLGCGLPVLTLRHRALDRFVREHDVGIALDDVGDAAARLDAVDYPALRSRVAAVRDSFTVERNIHRVLDVYERVRSK